MNGAPRNAAVRPGCGCLVPLVVAGGVLIALVIAVVALGGRHADPVAFRQRVYDDLSARFGTIVNTVECPDEIPASVGASFDCTVRFGQQPLTVHVKVI